MRIAAIVTCFSILFLSIPAVSSAKVDFKDESLSFSIFKHWKLFLSLIPIFAPVIGLDEEVKTEENAVEQDSSSQKIKVTGTLSSIRPPQTGDNDD